MTVGAVESYERHEDMVALTVKPCQFCDEGHDPIHVQWHDFLAWQNGIKIQQALFYLQPGVRETLISGSHEACFDEAFADGGPMFLAITPKETK